jgi:hypothetical protein
MNIGGLYRPLPALRLRAAAAEKYDRKTNQKERDCLDIHFNLRELRTGPESGRPHSS